MLYEIRYHKEIQQHLFINQKLHKLAALVVEMFFGTVLYLSPKQLFWLFT